MKRKLSQSPLLLLSILFLSGCISKNSNVTSSAQYDVMIHQLRVELEEIKHHIHTTVVQMNILTNKMVNSEDTIFELKQRDLITQKQTLESNSIRLAELEKKLEALTMTEEKNSLVYKQLEEEIVLHTRSLHQNKKKIHEIEKSAISIKANTE